MRPTFGGWRRLALLLVVLTALAAVAGAATTNGQPSGQAVLNDTRDHYANAESVVVTANVTVSNESANRTATVEFAAAGNESRTVVAADNATYRTGVNETVAWYVGPNRTAAWERDAVGHTTGVEYAGNASTPNDFANWSAADANASVEYLRRGSDDGTDAHVVRVVPEDGDADATLWVATSDARLLRAEVTDGENSTVVDYRESQVNVSVHGSTFDPPGDRLSITSVDRYDTFDAVQTNTSFDLPDSTPSSATPPPSRGPTGLTSPSGTATTATT
ncbi:outer membrane lipoprotein carrier protein LolA [Haloplanus litoreus]|uniref:LolA family protein n=1 Tax=Haloplanus litoreus TaxID=767515 RepID=UPI003618D9DA